MSEPTNIGELRSQIAHKIKSQQLPRAGEHKIFAGYGQNEICNACEKPVGKPEVLYEVEKIDAQRGTVVLALHRRCFNLWIEESTRRPPDTGQPLSGTGWQ